MSRKDEWMPVTKNPQLVPRLKSELLRMARHLEESRHIRHDEDGAILSVMVGFFMLRKLIQDKHVTKKTASLKLEVFKCDFNDAYDADNRRWIETGDGVIPATYSRIATKLAASTIANKFVHAGYCVPLLTLDYEKEMRQEEPFCESTHEFLVLEESALRDGLYHEALAVPVSAVVALFKTAAADDSNAFKGERAYDSKPST